MDDENSSASLVIGRLIPSASGGEGQRCGNCLFWREGRCRRYPPLVSSQAVGWKPIWPEVDSSEWCGEWKSQG